MPRTADLHPHAEGVKKVTGAGKTQAHLARAEVACLIVLRANSSRQCGSSQVPHYFAPEYHFSASMSPPDTITWEPKTGESLMKHV
jgi:hypothetical protein